MTPSTKLGVQTLEPREVPTVASLDAGVLRITGTELADVITVRQSSTAITVDGVSDSFAVGSVNEIVVEGLGGNDTINLQKSGAVVTKKAVVFGGGGDDKLYGGNGSDHLDGGSGSDDLFGYGGNDRLAGDTGDDVLFGGSENDNLAGGSGKDTLIGDGGIDRLDGGWDADGYLDASSGENVHDDLFGNTIVGSGYTHHHFLGVAVSSDFGWYDANTNDSVLRREARAADRSGMIDREEMIALLRAAGDGGTVTGTELDDLKEITANESIGMSAAVRNLSKKVVYGDRANQWFTGGDTERNESVGNLFAGTTDNHLETLVGKWFLGTDRPMAKSIDRGVTFGYTAAKGQLFVNGPSPHDLNQGGVGDCYFLAGLGAVAEADPQRIRDMITENKDGTFTVRFFRDGIAEFVTVDRHLPVDAKGRLPFAGTGTRVNELGETVRRTVGDTSNELWVALVEKAYAQVNESGWIGRDGTNSYNGIGGKISPNWWDGKVSNGDGLNGGTIDTGMRHAANADAPLALLGAFKYSDVRAAFVSGKAVTFGSWWDPPNKDVFGLHVYVMIGFSDSEGGKVTVLNPHGKTGSKPHTLTLKFADLQANFGSWCSATL